MDLNLANLPRLGPAVLEKIPMDQIPTILQPKSVLFLDVQGSDRFLKLTEVPIKLLGFGAAMIGSGVMLWGVSTIIRALRGEAKKPP